MQQIATRLQSAAQTAQAAGDTTAATQLTQLAADFNTASSSGQLPNVPDLARAMGGHHHHRHIEPAADDSASTSAASVTSSANRTLSQPQGTYPAGGSGSTATDPVSIITSTLSSAGIAECTYKMPELM